MCTQATHEALKMRRDVFESVTEPGGWQPVEDDALEFRLCLLCKSTLSDGTMRSGRRFSEVLADVA